MIRKLKAAYKRYKPEVNIDLVIYWIAFHLIILYFIYGKGLRGK